MLSYSSGMLWRAGRHDLQLRSLPWLAPLRICLRRNKFSRWSRETASAEAAEAELRPSLIASSTCFRSSFLTTNLSRAVRPSCPAAEIVSSMLFAAVFCWFLLGFDRLIGEKINLCVNASSSSWVLINSILKYYFWVVDLFSSWELRLIRCIYNLRMAIKLAATRIGLYEI